MAKTLQNLKGAAKEVAAEILGDQNLQDEGKWDRREAAGRKEGKPSPVTKGLHDLT
jgi:uncharacterized protein YjbJ (UPF0337 family)